MTTSGGDDGIPQVRNIAAIDMSTGRYWNITSPSHGELTEDATAILGLRTLARSMEGHIAGGFHPDAHMQLLTQLFSEVNLSPTWHQSADIRQLTAGALGIPPTHTPTAEQTCNLWGVSVRNARHSAAQMAKAAAACFDALEHFGAAGRTVMSTR
ncbi:hypothetical protein EP51_44210 (plasmid) [Rhodococcus opacus]|uniref:Uncharacterized protein n=1 Tax=Rhodococcus opacus TaxID=37919 RepID=A0A076F5Z0_RHOOP|nr:hypothetical protein EP51_44210 [Rhodococcus opacus]